MIMSVVTASLMRYDLALSYVIIQLSKWLTAQQN